MSTRVSELLACEDAGVTKLAVDEVHRPVMSDAVLTFFRAPWRAVLSNLRHCLQLWCWWLQAGGSVWAATAAPIVNQWRIRAELPAPPPAVTSPRNSLAAGKGVGALRRSSVTSPVTADGSVFVAAASPVVRIRQTQDAGDAICQPRPVDPPLALYWHSDTSPRSP